MPSRTPPGTTSPARPAAQLRRVQGATADPKVRIPVEESAVEASGAMMVPAGDKLFTIQESIGLMPLMEWAVATEDVDAGNQGQLASMFRLLKDLVAPDQWMDFRKHTSEAKWGPDEFVKFINAAIEAMAARPTQEPATS